ncbi:MAG: hypothetical protein Q9216_004875 [Gyalolechia sp. 2 TL-2023]
MPDWIPTATRQGMPCDQQNFIVGAWLRGGYNTDQIARALNHLENTQHHSTKSVAKIKDNLRRLYDPRQTDPQHFGVWQRWEDAWRQNDDADQYIYREIRSTMEEVLMILARNSTKREVYEHFKDAGLIRDRSEQVKITPHDHTASDQRTLPDTRPPSPVKTSSTEERSEGLNNICRKRKEPTNSTTPNRKSRAAEEASNDEGLRLPKGNSRKRKYNAGATLFDRMSSPAEADETEEGPEQLEYHTRKRRRPAIFTAPGGITPPVTQAYDIEMDSEKLKRNSRKPKTSSTFMALDLTLLSAEEAKYMGHGLKYFGKRSRDNEERPGSTKLAASQIPSIEETSAAKDRQSCQTRIANVSNTLPGTGSSRDSRFL